MNFKLPYQSYRVFAKAEENLVLPYFLGASIRGGLGYVLKKFVCIQKKQKDCKVCLIKHSCTYSFLFESAIIKNDESELFSLKKGEKIPQPWVIDFDLSAEKTFPKGTLFSFDFSLLGKGIEYLPYIIYSLERLGDVGIGRKGKFKLESVYVDDNVIYRNGTIENLKDKELIISLNTQNQKIIDEVSLNFITPIRIKHKNRLMTPQNFNIPVLLKALLRRLSLILYFYCDKQLIPREKIIELVELSENVAVISKNLHWIDLSRYSTRNRERIYLGGFIGNITLHKVPDSIIELLKIGEIIHIGKGTSFGLGKYRVGIL